MFNMRFRFKHVLMTTIIVVAASAFASAANSRVLPQMAPRSAVVAGWIIFVGGPNPTNPAVRHTSGTVIVRTDEGRLVARVHATRKHGYRLDIAPGHYELYAIIPIERNGIHTVEHSCGIEPKVTLHAGVNSPVPISVGCEIP
jgi:hypothetical protein